MQMTNSRWAPVAALGILTILANPNPAFAKTARPTHKPAAKAAVKRAARPAAKPAASKRGGSQTASAALADARIRRSYTDNWPMYRGNPKHTAFSPTNVNLPLTPAWTWQGDAIAVASSPTIVDGIVYIGTRDDNNGNKGSLLALDLATGKLKWRYNISDKSRTLMTHSAKIQVPATPGANTDAVAWVDSSPAVVNGRVYVMSRDGALHCLTTDGQLKWRLRTGGLDMSSPNVANGTVYMGSGYPNKDFWAVDATSGVVKWRTNSGLPDPAAKRPGQFVYSSQSVANGVVYGAANDGGFYALDALTGKLKWRYETQGGVYFYSPMLAGSNVIAAPGDYDTAVYAINAATGKLTWKFQPTVTDSTGKTSPLPHSYVSSPAYDGDTVYVGVGDPDQMIEALDATSGQEKWKYVTGYATQNSYTSSPAVTNNVVLVGTAQPHRTDPESGRLVALDKATGQVLWEYKLPKPVLSSPSVAGNYVVVGCMDGTVRAFTWTP